MSKPDDRPNDAALEIPVGTRTSQRPAENLLPSPLGGEGPWMRGEAAFDSENHPHPQPFSHPGRGEQRCAGANDEIPEDPRIVEVVQEYMSQLDQGRTPNRAEFLNRYPELADAVRQCLEGLELVRGGAAPSSSSLLPGRFGAAVRGAGDAPPAALGDFQIVRELARGGMGIVYEAVQLSLGRRVALKVLPFAATLDARQLQRFKNEAQAAALLHHTNIVPVFAVGCERGVHYYAMQLIDGQSLAALIAQLRRQAGLGAPGSAPTDSRVRSSYILGGEQSRGEATPSDHPTLAVSPKPPEGGVETAPRFHANLSTQHAGRDGRFYRTAARLLLQAAQALEHAHEFGIVHRDIKPGNLLLDTQGVLWVTDFGLAQFHTDAGLTGTGDIPGTLRYMSPEQASGQQPVLDARTDIYSLGATFYELLTLRPMFAGRNLQSLLHQILHAEPRALRQIDRTIPGELETIILKCVSKTPADRYRSAAELAADVQRYLDHKPILARRPTLIDRGRKWSRRHPSVIVAGMLLLAVVSVGLFISNRLISSEQRKTESALDRARERADEAERRFQQARQAVDMLIQVSEEELGDGPPEQHARKRLLEIALGYYEEFIEQRRGDATLAAVEERVKRILYELALVQREMDRQLLDWPQVWDEMSLTEAQKATVAALQSRWKQERNSIPTDVTLDDQTRRQRFIAIAEEHDRALEELLTKEQLRRWRQVALQTQGLFAFKDPQVIDALKLTAQQRQSIRQIEREVFGRHFGPRGPGPADRPPPRHEDPVSRILAVLTADQVRAWKELTGVRFRGQDDPQFRPLRVFGPPDQGRGPRDGPRRERFRFEGRPRFENQLPDGEDVHRIDKQ